MHYTTSDPAERYLGAAVVGVAVGARVAPGRVGARVVGLSVGLSVVGVAVLGTAVLQPQTRSLSTQHSFTRLFPKSISNHGVA